MATYNVKLMTSQCMSKEYGVLGLDGLINGSKQLRGM